MHFKKHSSKNFSERNNNIIDKIILHYTVITDLDATLKILLGNTENEVSSHYLIDYDGIIHKLVHDNHKAWHAGVSHWGGQDNINESSIGIEILNSSEEEFNDIQMQSVLNLCLLLKDKYSVEDKNIIGHSDIAVSRKIDPGKFFNWQWLSENNIGLWHHIESEDKEILLKINDKGEKVKELQTKLNKLGYKIAIDGIFGNETYSVCRAFKLHYYANDDREEWNKASELRLNKLIELI